MIRFANVSMQYPRGGAALDRVSFTVQRGEFCFLVGPSGAGKSTILKLIHLEERPTAGELHVDGRNTGTLARREIPFLRRRIGVVFQDFRLLEDRTAEQNIAFALEVTGTPASAIPTKVARVLARVGLSGKGMALPHELSGGEQQRVAIARAIVNDPVLLLADEPTGNLDERAAHGVFQLLLDIHATGTAVLMATHDMDLVRYAERRTLELQQGRLIADTAGSARPPRTTPTSSPTATPTSTPISTPISSPRSATPSGAPSEPRL